MTNYQPKDLDWEPPCSQADLLSLQRLKHKPLSEEGIRAALVLWNKTTLTEGDRDFLWSIINDVPPSYLAPLLGIALCTAQRGRSMIYTRIRDLADGPIYRVRIKQDRTDDGLMTTAHAAQILGWRAGSFKTLLLPYGRRYGWPMPTMNEHGHYRWSTDDIDTWRVLMEERAARIGRKHGV